MTDFLDNKRWEISNRITELEGELKRLEPLTKEHERLKAAESALDRLHNSTPSRAPARRRVRRRLRGSKHRPSSASPKSTPAAKAAGRKRRARRPKGTGPRATDTLELIRAQPGITVPELAARMGIQRSYLYHVLPRLQREGEIKKEGRSWHPMAKEKATA